MNQNRYKSEEHRSSGAIGSRLKERGRKKRGKRRFFNKKWILMVAITTFLLVIGGCSAVMISAKSMPLDKLEEVEFASTLYDVEGKAVTKLGSNNREYVAMKHVKSRKLIEDTFVAVEDRRFYQHHGVDFKSIARAVYNNLIQGRKAEGGGTITMQVARNVVLENINKTYTRKLKEVAVAWNLERKHSKKEILQAYLNFIYYGNDVQGIQMASKIYFDKDLTKDELEPQEVALLAGLPKAPSRYNPYQNQEEARKRRNIVLMLMAEQGVITEEEKEKYQKMELGVNRKYLEKYLKNDEYQAYKHYVMIEASKRFNIPEEELATGGYKIRTHLVPRAQKGMEAAFKNDSLFKNSDDLDGGATIVNPKTGGIAAIAGGREYLGTGYTLRSVEETKQPGSAIKPITVYAPVVEQKNYNEYTPVPDPAGFRIGSWKPQNLQLRSFGKPPLKDVLAKSLNVATAWLLKNEVGLETATRYGEQMGLEFDRRDKSSYAALALGGLTHGVNTVDMAQAYVPFINNGKMNEAHAIESISTRDRSWQAEGEFDKEREVFSPKTAYYMTRMMHYNVQQGTGRSAQLPDGRDVAGKTGTTQESQTAWFVGYTNEYVMSAMVYNKENGKVRLTGGEYPARIFKEVMTEAVRGTPVSRFKNPGVPLPKPPFVLKAVSLQGSYDSDSRSVQLSWKDYDNRLRYRVERSEGSGWKEIGMTSDGSFTDRDVLKGGELDAILKGNSRQYSYRVIAVDTVTNEEASPSNVVTVQLNPPKEEPPDEGEIPGDQKGDDESGNQEGEPGEEQPGHSPGDQEGDPPGNQEGEDQEGEQDSSEQGRPFPPIFRPDR
ncbi:hypothetical protein GXN76_02780 [Kroppenstedtia pulmonis]|uniref:Uncharacterized protein n=1 Tax=Kroppenstedtia pulmonis TaxID=1380685 RepID=A0A7D3Y8C6_9BACL|nr:transglycosylase domain-containing protein [Kroppenstedtia pulmonis]QKG83501.1 hypothetical protein GXN76_02780 [Kroppenstedtia pulmonis]